MRGPSTLLLASALAGLLSVTLVPNAHAGLYRGKGPTRAVKRAVRKIERGDSHLSSALVITNKAQLSRDLLAKSAVLRLVHSTAMDHAPVKRPASFPVYLSRATTISRWKIPEWRAKAAKLTPLNNGNYLIKQFGRMVEVEAEIVNVKVPVTNGFRGADAIVINQPGKQNFRAIHLNGFGKTTAPELKTNLGGDIVR